MSDKELPFTPENIAKDVLDMSGKHDSERKSMADKASYKFSTLFHNTSAEEFRAIYNEVSLQTRLDADKTQKVFCKTEDGKVHDNLKVDDKNIKEIWIGNPANLFDWGNYQVFSQQKEDEKQKKNQASLSHRQGMLKTLLDENKLE
ncbi:MAG: hypothetical protein K2Y22_07600 [Candidatus Obscuribacterales bacterium]|nr:hypothetical protein [Candidatus Obscuribacterales bacterium]